MAFKPVKKIYKAGKTLKTLLKNRYHDIFMVIWLWTLVNDFGNTSTPFEKSSTNVPLISKSNNDFGLSNDANRIIYNLVKKQITSTHHPDEKDISKVELCCNNNSSININTARLDSKNITNHTTTPVVKSKSNSHFFANAFTIKENGFLRRPVKLFSDLLGPHGAFENSNKTQPKTYLNLTDDYTQTCAASSSSGNSSGSGSGNNGSGSGNNGPLIDSQNSGQASDKIIDRQYFNKNSNKARKKNSKYKKKRRNKTEN